MPELVPVYALIKICDTQIITDLDMIPFPQAVVLMLQIHGECRWPITIRKQRVPHLSQL